MFGVANRNDMPTPKGYKSYAKVLQERKLASGQAREEVQEGQETAGEGGVGRGMQKGP